MAALAPSTDEQNLPGQDSGRFSEALHRYWGYESYRPGQENIVRSIAAGRDACVVMPTGGGKSLCYQLPAVLDAQRTVGVVSPLIALMQDQVAQLEQMGIPAGFLNSSLSSEQRSAVLRHASEGHYRLLYLSPERIALDGTPACHPGRYARAKGRAADSGPRLRGEGRRSAARSKANYSGNQRGCPFARVAPLGPASARSGGRPPPPCVARRVLPAIGSTAISPRQWA